MCKHKNTFKVVYSNGNTHKVNGKNDTYLNNLKVYEY